MGLCPNIARRSSSDPKVKDNTNNSNIALTLGALGQKEVSMMWSAWADTHFPEAALVGNIANIDPATANNQNLTTLNGIPTDTLTETEIITLVGRNVNYYVKEYGAGAYHEGFTFGGDFIDTVRNSQWAKAKTEESLYSLFKTQADLGKLVPYTDIGGLMIETRITQDVINVGIRGGSIATGFTTDDITGSTIDLNPVVRAGTRAQQTNTNIAQRVWDNVLVEYVYVSGINHVKVNMYLILNREAQAAAA